MLSYMLLYFSHTLNARKIKIMCVYTEYIVLKKINIYNYHFFYFVDCTSKAFASVNDIGKGKRNVTFRVEREKKGERKREKNT